MAIDPYVYPGTNVLKNLAGIDDQDRLQRFEAVSTAHRISELRFSPVRGAFDLTHLRRIHQHIFQDVYPWAGEFRTVDIRKEGDFWFCRHEFMEQTLSELFERLSSENELRNTTPNQFAPRAAFYLGELNAIHPFRDGNGRVQREFIRELGLSAGLRVDWAQVTQEEMYRASIASFQNADLRPLEDLIFRITTVLDLS
jgi:cell filamentation protein